MNEKPRKSKIVSDAPGRMRIRLRPGDRQPGFMHRLKDEMEKRKGVHKVGLNPATGSVTLHYDHHRVSKEGLIGFLDDLNVVAREIVPALGVPGGGDDSGPKENFLQAIGDLNRYIRQFTGLRIDLKLVLPLTFVGVGLWSIRKHGLMVAQVPAWIFLWMAFDLFIKLHPAVPAKQGA